VGSRAKVAGSSSRATVSGGPGGAARRVKGVLVVGCWSWVALELPCVVARRWQLGWLQWGRRKEWRNGLL